MVKPELPMSRQSPFLIELSDDDRAQLEVLVRKPTAEHRSVRPARIVLAAADGMDNVIIADHVEVPEHRPRVAQAVL